MERQLPPDVLGIYVSLPYVVGADGRLDFCVMPSYDSVALVKTEGSWKFLSVSQKELILSSLFGLPAFLKLPRSLCRALRQGCIMAGSDTQPGEGIYCATILRAA